MTRRERIRRALDRAQAAGEIGGYYCQGGMPGLRWTVWGTLVGRSIYGPGASPMTCSRTYSTRGLEDVLRATGYWA